MTRLTYQQVLGVPGAYQGVLRSTWYSTVPGTNGRYSYQQARSTRVPVPGTRTLGYRWHVVPVLDYRYLVPVIRRTWYRYHRYSEYSEYLVRYSEYQVSTPEYGVYSEYLVQYLVLPEPGTNGRYQLRSAGVPGNRTWGTVGTWYRYSTTGTVSFLHILYD